MKATEALVAEPAVMQPSAPTARGRAEKKSGSKTVPAK
jgi:hypothetical protein